jgi:glucose-1-phosphate cytidylyltransferase
LGGETFCFTYGDGIGDVNITELVALHKREGRQATLTGVQPPGRFGALEISGNQIKSFHEKPDGDGSWINGGFFVLEPSVIDLIDGDATVWERKPLEALAHTGQLGIYKHAGFWQPMDTLRDRQLLEELWASGKAPWKKW